MPSPLTQAKNVLNNMFNNKLLNKNVEKISVEDIAKNSGKIVDMDGRKTAVYKNEKGEVIKLNPKCTHMGCDVEWNDGKKEWHCPCHNSNFKATGEVIEGPAKTDLEKMV